MHKVTVKAYNGIGKDKVFAGEREVDCPDTLEDCKALEGGDEKPVVEAYWASKAIDIQRQIRAGTGTSAKAQLNVLIAKAKDDPKVAELLRAADIKLPWEAANGTSEEAPKGEEAPPTPPTPEKEPEKPAEKAPARNRRR